MNDEQVGIWTLGIFDFSKGLRNDNLSRSALTN
jgi:hypothetical protein